jgi:hypothetical protein
MYTRTQDTCRSLLDPTAHSVSRMHVSDAIGLCMTMQYTRRRGPGVTTGACAKRVCSNRWSKEAPEQNAFRKSEQVTQKRLWTSGIAAPIEGSSCLTRDDLNVNLARVIMIRACMSHPVPSPAIWCTCITHVNFLCKVNSAAVVLVRACVEPLNSSSDLVCRLRRATCNIATRNHGAWLQVFWPRPVA